MTTEATTPKRLDDVPGWFTITDQLLFEWLLTWQTRTEFGGDLVELGVFEGKSAIQMGRFVADGETLTVLDLFEDAAEETTIRPGARARYTTLSQQQFESNYLAFHDQLPVVIRGLSSTILDHVNSGSCRFVHIDASHLYEHVRIDTAAAREVLLPDGIVVFDDFRTEHTIGTAAAVWEAIVADGLHPICASSMKMYATWGDPEPKRREILERLAERSDHRADIHEVMRGERIIRVARPKKKAGAKKAGAKRPASNVGAPSSSPRASSPPASLWRLRWHRVLGRR